MSFHNVKLESSSTSWLRAPLPAFVGRPVPASCCGHSAQDARFRAGLARTLSPAEAGPTPSRALRRLWRARHGIAVGPREPLGSPVPGCLAPGRPQVVAGGLAAAAAVDPAELAQGLLSPLILPSPFPWLWFR